MEEFKKKIESDIKYYEERKAHYVEQENKELIFYFDGCIDTCKNLLNQIGFYDI